MSILRRLFGLVTFPYWLARRKISVQLMYSHVLVVILTVIVIEALSAAALLGLVRWGAISANEPNWTLGSDAQIVAETFGNDEAFQSPGLTPNGVQRQHILQSLRRIMGRESATAGASMAGLDIDKGLVADINGRVLASSDPLWAQAGQFAPSIASSLVARTTERAVELGGEPTRYNNTWLLDWDDDQTIASNPIINNQGEFAGVVTIQTGSISPVPSIITREMVIGFLTANLVLLVVITVPAFLASMPVGIWTARAFSKRLSALSEAADAMSQGNLSRRVEIKGEDEISRLGERFNEMSARLAEADRSRRAFVANVSHELRTPLAIIEGHVESLAHANGDDRSLAVIQQEARTLERLVDDLFTLARLEEAVLPFDLEPVSVYEVATEAVDGMKTVAWEQRKVTVQSLVSPGVPRVLADRTRLRQILGNLLYNALRHTAEGGLVILSAARQANVVEMSVTDTGIGIDEQELERVFDRFYQTERTSRQREGSGLGLAIVKQLVEAQGGSIDVTSVPGEGTTFRFTLPVAG